MPSLPHTCSRRGAQWSEWRLSAVASQIPNQGHRLKSTPASVRTGQAGACLPAWPAGETKRPPRLWRQGRQGPVRIAPMSAHPTILFGLASSNRKAPCYRAKPTEEWCLTLSLNDAQRARGSEGIPSCENRQNSFCCLWEDRPRRPFHACWSLLLSFRGLQPPDEEKARSAQCHGRHTARLSI